VIVKTLAIIPARGQSKRIPRKNLRPFLGVPLVARSIGFARALPAFDRVLVSTDDSEIAAVSRRFGADVPYLRPAELATDTSGSAGVALHVLEQEERAGNRYDMVALLQPTSPIRSPERWEAAFRLLEKTACNAVIGVAPARNHPFHSFSRDDAGLLHRFVAAADLTLRTQDLPPAYVVIGNLYLIRAGALREHGTFFPPATASVVCDGPLEALDIDTEDDWVVAETLARHYGMTS
jgi:CMP-N-acetylneuraminic acid synthetase